VGRLVKRGKLYLARNRMLMGRVYECFSDGYGFVGVVELEFLGSGIEVLREHLEYSGLTDVKTWMKVDGVTSSPHLYMLKLISPSRTTGDSLMDLYSYLLTVRHLHRLNIALDTGLYRYNSKVLGWVIFRSPYYTPYRKATIGEYMNMLEKIGLIEVVEKRKGSRSTTYVIRFCDHDKDK